ncbi:hypothetical protein [Spongiivirga citrea]|uniref:Uncharacterized protein n=1 Tax=Spongiivirga citrea TaxID=1481457 RepID=A0A6M0CFX1_9FLAO|nr:hypothetical protein [Spongiivirga citrea]NER16786.1 hypothetical protein [Spongiivirga citrea]
MKRREMLFYTILATFFVATTSIAQQQKSAQNAIFLGTVVQQKGMVFNKSIEASAVVNWIEKQPLSVTVTDFTQKSYALYKKAIRDQGKTVFFEYHDSIAEKPTYLTLKLADKVGIIEQLEQSQNKKLLHYIENSEDNELVNEVNILVQQPMYDQIVYAQKVYLHTTKNGLLALQLQNGKTTQSITSNQFQVFGFETACLCWKLGEREDVIVVDLAAKSSSCPKGTKSHPRKLKRKKEERYDRF